MIVLHGLAGFSNDEMFISELKLEFESKLGKGMIPLGIKIYEKGFYGWYRKLSRSTVCMKSFPLFFLFKSF